ncbi:ricin-type beta-trefoil lectin domain protein [Streptomyces cynarae]|uniref:Ricin-type beta-trefoil lectin domain protein n=1 Tax=Streptomyces cynarae TaxID=2981134 RepID=A0ABY6E8R5_9ACTN|nr:RICIN domain-containing protein [Streptomyces cynarae]UXY22965.1 ricin-type beta-trefoil lectin domain protein [Streptomyces cynarae]
MATATVAASAMVVQMAVAQGVPEYHYKGKLWSAGPTYKTPSVGGHPLTRRTVELPKSVQPLRTYRPARPAWPSAGSSTVALMRMTQSSRSASKHKAGGEPAASPVRAGALPVWVGPAKKAGAGSRTPTSVRVRMASHAQVQAAGANGMLVGFGRGDGAPSSGRVAITLDYSALDKAYGGGWASRLHLVSVPGCILTTPQKAACRVRTPLTSANDPVAKKLTATLDLPGATSSSTVRAGIHADTTSSSTSMAPMTAVEAISGTSGSQGDYTATSLAPSGAWSATGTGAFTYSYPISVPRSLGGSAPGVALSYDSQSEDGETSARNSQSSWVGDGWSYSPGFIERSYKPCKQDGISNSSDLCWGGWAATLSLNGHSGTLVRDDSSNSATPTATQTWHLQGDDGTKVEELGGAGNGLWNGEYFKVTTTDGTAYYFGLNHAPGTTSDPATNSAWGEPVYSPNSQDPCYDSSQGKNSQCTMGYRFNLDFVVDPHSNVQRYTYATETNYYDRGGGQVAASGGSGTLTKYIRGGYLTEIDYGYQLTDEIAGSKPGARVLFNTAQRCQTSSTFTDCSYSNLNNSTATNWPDVPYDLNCPSTDVTSGTGSNVCLTTAPSFWSTYRLDSIVTQVNAGGTLTNVDTYQLNQTYSDAGGTVDPVTGQSGKDSADQGELQSVMWLSSIQHTGDDTTGGGSSSAITLPKVSFLGTEIDNRVDGGSQPPLFHPRISSITTETGKSIAVTYDDPDCSRLNNTMPSAPDADTMSCYNVYWTTPGGVNPVSDWFNKTRVKTVDVSDATGAGSPMQVSNYTYSGPAWHRDDSELTDDTHRTWDQFRGYRTVTVTTGAAPDPITQTTTTYLQGMDGDLRADGSKRSVTVTDSAGDNVTDSDWLTGTPLEADTYSQASGSVDAKHINLPQSFTTTATHSRGSSLPALVARMIKTSQQRNYGLLSSGMWRQSETDTSYNNAAMPTTVDAKGDVSVASQEKCATTSYATPPSGNSMMLAYPDEILTVAGPCGTTPSASNTVSDKRVFYDGDGTVANPGTLGHLGTTGNLTATQVITGYSSGTATYRTTQATAYDKYGRATQVQDAAANTTKTTFTPTAGQLPTQVVSTNPQGWNTTSVMDPLRGLTLTSTDPNGRVTTVDYDALGRRTAMWLPGRPTSQSASRTFTYAVNGTTAPTTVTTNTLRDDGNYSTAITIYDGMLQPRQEQSTTANNQAGRLISDTFYDSHGWARKANNTYYESTTSPTTTMWVANDTQVPSQQVTVHDGQGRTTATQLWSKGTQQWQSTIAYPGVDRTDTTPAQGGTATSAFTNALGQTTATWKYDDTATPTGKASDAIVTSYTYTPAGQVATMSDNAGNTWSYTYDLLGQEIKQTDPDTGTTTFDKYDQLGNLLQTTDARGQTLSYTYDALDRKTAEYSGAWSATPDTSKELASFSYDTLAKGHPTSSTRYVGGAGGDAYTQAITGYTTDYQPTGAATTIPTSTGFPSNNTGTNSNTYSVKYSYTPIMGLLSETDYGADGSLPAETVGYGYDLQGLLDGFGGTSTYLDTTNYTPLGQVTDTRWGLYGEQVEPTFSYDGATGRVTQSSVNLQTSSTSALDVTSYRYNQAGDVTAISDSQSGGTTDTQCFTYDQLNRLTTAWTDTAGLTSAGVGSTGGCTTSTPAASTIGGPAPYWQSYSYNALGDRTQQVQHDTSGNTANDLTRTATYPGSGTTAATLPNTATQITTTGPNGTATMTPHYDGVGNTTGRTVTTTGPLVSGLTRSGTKLCVDDSSSGTTDGNKIQIYTCNGTSAQQWTMGTDGTVRVLGKCLDVSGGGTANGTKIDLYTCNGGAGQQWKAGANGSLVNPASGKCLDDPSSSTTNGTQLQIYTCNATSAQRWTNVTMGNVLPGATQSFAYDAEGRTASVTTPSGGKDQSTSYLYDAGGSLLLQTTPTSKILYLFGGAEQLTLTTGAGTVSGLRYYPGPDGVTEVRSSDGTLAYKVSNVQGTATTEIAASNLAVTRRYFDPYGNPRGPQPTAWADNHGYLGKPTDATTGLDLLGARNYDPVQGRFLTADPLMEAGDPNQMSGYSYAADNPASSSDPTGYDDWYNDPSMNVCVIDCGSSGTDNSGGGTGGGGTTSSSGDTTAAPAAAPACNVASKFGCDVYNAYQMGHHGPPTSGKLKDFVAGMLDEALQQLEQLSPGGAMMNSAHDLANGMAPGIVGPPAYVAPRHAVAHALHAHTNTDAYKAGKATTVILEVAASGGDAPEGAVAAIADARDTQDAIAAAAEVKNVISETTEEATATAAVPSKPSTGASGNGEGGCSFSPSTRVLLAQGKTKAIAAVKPGDKVEAGDPTTGKRRGPRTVQHVWINHDHDLLDVTIRTKDGHTATLHTTANHPFWDDTTHSWVPAGKLRHGDALSTATNGHVYVAATHTTPGTANRWNLTVQQLHTYYVLAAGTPVLVHNSNGPTIACSVPAAGGPGEGIPRSAAKAQALSDAGVPEGSDPLESGFTPSTTKESQGGKQLFDENYQPIHFPEEFYLTGDGEIVVYQDHYTGHSYGAGGVGDQPPHVHVRPYDDQRNGVVPGAQEHYYYDPSLG